MASIDLWEAYLQVPVHPESRRFLRFVAHGRTYQSCPRPRRSSLGLWVLCLLFFIPWVSVCVVTWMTGSSRPPPERISSGISGLSCPSVASWGSWSTRRSPTSPRLKWYSISRGALFVPFTSISTGLYLWLRVSTAFSSLRAAPLAPCLRMRSPFSCARSFMGLRRPILRLVWSAPVTFMGSLPQACFLGGRVSNKHPPPPKKKKKKKIWKSIFSMTILFIELYLQSKK